MADNPRLIDVTLVADTSQYASGEVLVIPQLVTGVTFDKNRPCILDSVQLIDEDDQGAALDLYLFDIAAVLGTINASPTISDADARGFLGIVAIATADYKDLGGVRIASKNNLGLIIKPVVDTQSIYIGAVNGSGTPTYTASGLKLRLGTRKF